jgi:hypothetical protein
MVPRPPDSLKCQNPGLAVNSEGRVGAFYQQLTGPGGTRWEHHVQFTHNGVDWDDVLLANTAATNWTGDYNFLQAHGRDFYGTFATDNTPDLANFPHGVRYQRNVNFATKQLLDLTGTTVIPASIDPFFFKIVHEEEEEEEEAVGGFEWIEIKGLKYEKLEIKELRFLESGERGEDMEEPQSKARAISRLLRRVAAHLGEDDRDEDSPRDLDDDD